MTMVLSEIGDAMCGVCKRRAKAVFWIAGLLVFSLHLCHGAHGDDDMEKRERYLDQLRRVLPKSVPWETWLEESGELPPDFEAMPSMADPPDPLLREQDGKQVRITSTEAWPARRDELKALLHRWVIGSVPLPPDNIEATVLAERDETGAVSREVELRFGPGHKAKLWLELLVPQGDGPFPVFMTQENHRGWALIALRRGYLACVYAGSDSRDDTDTFVEAYPDHDWSRLTRRAWAAGRCIDYLATVPQADTDHIALTGHSRNGKQSLIASALDERISAVISSSSGAGGSLSARYCGEHHFGEGIESITRTFPDWFHPRWRFFAGREHKLPVDLHELVALSAPRPCLLSIALNDGVETSWSMEETYLAVKPVYELLGAEDRLRILWRPGGHETWPTVIERYLDWCDLHFGRGQYSFPERFIHPHNWENWRKQSAVQIHLSTYPTRPLDDGPIPPSAKVQEWERRRNELRAAVKEMMGAAPAANASETTYGREPAHIEELLRRRAPGRGLQKQDVMFGEYINADVYMRSKLAESGEKAPAILWLHPHSNPAGYVAAYRRGEQAFNTFARAGYAVFCFDQVGFGRRIEEVEGFYSRYPQWSLMGKMVRDAQAALDAMMTLPYVDPDRIWVVGYSLGAMVGMHLGAIDERPAGFVFVCGPPPFRLDTNTAETGGIRRWSHLHMLLPKLGFFIGDETRVPYDVDELVASIAPRHALLVTPQLDREAPLEMVTRGVEAARKVYNLYDAEHRLVQTSPEKYNHFDTGMQRVVLDLLKDYVQNR